MGEEPDEMIHMPFRLTDCSRGFQRDLSLSCPFLRSNWKMKFLSLFYYRNFRKSIFFENYKAWKFQKNDFLKKLTPEFIEISSLWFRLGS